MGLTNLEALTPPSVWCHCPRAIRLVGPSGHQLWWCSCQLSPKKGGMFRPGLKKFCRLEESSYTHFFSPVNLTSAWHGNTGHHLLSRILKPGPCSCLRSGLVLDPYA